MATIVYLDAEDEITSAATRIRQAKDKRVGLVIPYGSRVATSRINFKLLSREAMVSGRRLDIVAPDASARALAGVRGAARVLVGGGVRGGARRARRRHEAGRHGGDGGRCGCGRRGRGPRRARREGQRDQGPPGRRGRHDRRPGGGDHGRAPRPVDVAAPGAHDAAMRRGAGRGRPPQPRGPGREAPPAIGPAGALIAGLIVLLLGLGAAAVAAFLFLPTADITITPHVEAVGPIDLVVTADPGATAVDEEAGVIPAQTVQIPVEVADEFPATGRRVEETAARGAVRMRNCDPSAAYTIPSGTILRTDGGVGFSLDESLFLPVAVISGSGANVDLRCSTSDVSVTAVEQGPDGNVPAGSITVVPARYNRTLITATNPSATDGGTREEFTRVSRRDVQSALETLDAQLAAQFESQLEDPSTVPAGTTLFPETAVMGEATPTVDPETLVNEEVESFTLGLTATGSALAVDESPVEAIAETQLEAAVTPGWVLVPDSTRVAVGEGTVAGDVVEFRVAGVAKQVQPVDGEALRSQVMGLPADDARAVLAPYGDVDLRLWPDMVTTVPTLGQRVTLVVLEPVDDAPIEEPVPATAAPTEPPTATPDGESPGEPVPSG